MDLKIKNLILEPTNICNLSCKMCPRNWVEMPLGVMSLTLFESILGEVEPGTTIVLVWRGEPTLAEILPHMIRRSYLRTKDVVLATNGTMPHVLGADEFRCLRSINVSIHGKESLEGLKDILSRKGGDTHVQGSMVDGEDTGVAVEDLRCADSVRIYREHTADGVAGRLARQEIPAEKTERGGICHRLLTDLVIAWDGSISRCCYDWHTWPLEVLDANRQTLEEIWSSDTLREVRENYPEGPCITCDQWKGEGRTL